MSELLKLADRCEGPSEVPERHLIEQSAAHLALHQLWPERGDDTALAGQFFTFLNAGAFLSAAALLVPESFVWSVLTDFGLPGRARVYGAVLGKRDHGVQCDAATPALALTAACLRACDSGRQPQAENGEAG